MALKLLRENSNFNVQIQILKNPLNLNKCALKSPKPTSSFIHSKTRSVLVSAFIIVVVVVVFVSEYTSFVRRGLAHTNEHSPCRERERAKVKENSASLHDDKIKINIQRQKRSERGKQAREVVLSAAEFTFSLS
jgi:hypothetical protein